MPEKEPRSDFEELLNELGMSASEYARATGASQNVIHRRARGETRLLPEQEGLIRALLASGRARELLEKASGGQDG